MKREHFEWLLRHWTEELYSFVLDPVCQGVSSETRDEWVRLGIISSPTILNVLAQTKNFGRLMQLEIGSEGCIASERPISLTMRLINKAFNLPNDRLEGEFVRHQFIGYSVDFEKLLSHMAEQWGIRPVFYDAFPAGVMMGVKDETIPVVILCRPIDRLLLPTVAIDTQANLKVRKIWIIKEGGTRLQDDELERLYELGIHFLGTEEFLTGEGKPNWDYEFLDSEIIQAEPHPALIVDPETNFIVLDGTILELQVKQERILAALITSGGKPVHRDDLREVIWPDVNDEPGLPDQGVIQHVYNLKQNLERLTSYTVLTLRGKSMYRLIKRQ